ncbi:MAG: hypothetical protein ACYS6K_23585 [Planctomycetota bacterium]
MKCSIYVISMLVAFSVTSYSQANWTTLDYPGGTNTQPRGIDGSDIVGYYNFNSGFLYDGSNWTTLNYPGDTATILEGIDGDTIVGSFTDWDDPWPVQVGCLYDRVTATWTPLSYPGSENTEACDIDGINIVGEYSNPWPNHQSHGFLYDGSNWTTLDYPGARGTFLNGIDGSNIVGGYYDSSFSYYSFLYDGSNWTTLDYPGAIETWATGIDRSNIVGFYDDYSGTHGFLYDGSNWTTLDYPGAVLTYPLGIDGSNIVGYYYDASMTPHGFLYNFETYAFSGWVFMIPDAPDFGYYLDEADLLYFYSFDFVQSLNLTAGGWSVHMPTDWIYFDWPFYYESDPGILWFALPPESGIGVYHFSTGEWELLPRIIP